MGMKNETALAYAVAFVLLAAGIVCYAAFPERPPEVPIRIMFENTAGKVLLDHKGHASEEGYGIACKDCHHDIEEEGAKPEACSSCHDPDAEIKLPEAFHKQCIGCHEEGGSGPVECSGCHLLL
jgi:hypothetical protein